MFAVCEGGGEAPSVSRSSRKSARATAVHIDVETASEQKHMAWPDAYGTSKLTSEREDHPGSIEKQRADVSMSNGVAWHDGSWPLQPHTAEPECTRPLRSMGSGKRIRPPMGRSPSTLPGPNLAKLGFARGAVPLSRRSAGSARNRTVRRHREQMRRRHRPPSNGSVHDPRHRARFPGPYFRPSVELQFPEPSTSGPPGAWWPKAVKNTFWGGISTARKMTR